LNDIIARAIPTTERQSKEESVEYNFCFTISSPLTEPALTPASSSASTAVGILFYCYVSYKLAVSVSSTRESFSNNNLRSTSAQHRSLVLVSRYPIPNLAYHVLSNIESTLYHVLHPDPKLTKTDATQDISKAFDVSLEQIHQNWAPLVLSRGDSEEMSTAGHGLSWYAGMALPFFGDVSRSLNLSLSLTDSLGPLQILQFTLSIPRCIGGVTISHEPTGINVFPDVDFMNMSLGAAVTFSNGSNIIAQFGPYGLIPHLWALWEFLLQGCDVVVVGPTADAASQVY
jgi:hypothetical protein